MTPNITQSDALEWLRSLDDASVDLIATDPPFGPGAPFDARWCRSDIIKHDATDALMNAAQIAVGEEMTAFLCWLGVRLLEMHRILRSTGSLYLHIDHNAHAWVKALLDGIFGRANFRNEIIWERTTSANRGKQFGRTHDTILYYSKSAERVWNPIYLPLSEGTLSKFRHNDNDGKGPYKLDPVGSPAEGYRYDLGHGELQPTNGYRMPESRARQWLQDGTLVLRKGKVTTRKWYLSQSNGVKLGSVWTDIQVLNSQAKERTGYPTQKPLALYERIISASSNEGDLVADPFCGSGTTLVAAKRLGRRFAGCDVNPEAVGQTRRRLS